MNEPMQSWEDRRLAFVRGLKRRSSNQIELLSLADKPARTDKEQRKLIRLLKIERLNEQGELGRRLAFLEVKRTQSDRRRERSHRLIELGGLVDIAGLADLDKGGLLGAFLAVADRLRQEDGKALFERYKVRGDVVLKRREEERKSRRKSRKEADAGEVATTGA